ncbi:MAG TPA: hypothetical protein VFQ96_00240, partial [Microbacteriaceae bacterium]|nr:hypothetical protein [Microbacteriaceae bacterium]
MISTGGVRHRLPPGPGDLVLRGGGQTSVATDTLLEAGRALDAIATGLEAGVARARRRMAGI